MAWYFLLFGLCRSSYFRCAHLPAIYMNYLWPINYLQKITLYFTRNSFKTGYWRLNCSTENLHESRTVNSTSKCHVTCFPPISKGFLGSKMKQEIFYQPVQIAFYFKIKQKKFGAKFRVIYHQSFLLLCAPGLNCSNSRISKFEYYLGKILKNGNVNHVIGCRLMRFKVIISDINHKTKSHLTIVLFCYSRCQNASHAFQLVFFPMKHHTQ